jgi:very-short-patch-repair endonuclease
MEHKRATSWVDREIARLAVDRPHGIFTMKHVAAANIGRTAISDRVRAGLLYRLHRGVYSVIPPRLLKIEGHWLAAVLACGPGAALSHLCAAALWELIRPPSGPIHVSVPTASGRKRRDGIVIHRSSTLLPSQITVENSIPVTTPARTLADLRRALPHYRCEPILRRAERLRLDTGPLHAGLDDPDRSELERRFQAVCRRHSLPMPDCQVIIGPYTVDFLWPEARLIVEVDGWDTHGTRSAFEADRVRDAWLTSQGYRVVRFTWKQVKYDGPGVARIVRAILGL